MTTKQRLLVSREVFEFNQDHPIGTPVRYWPGSRIGEGIVSRTRTIALMLGGHTSCVWVEGHSSFIALSHIEVLTSLPKEGAR